MADNTGQTSLNVSGSIIGVGVLAMMAGIGYGLLFVQIPQQNAQLFSTFLGLVGIQFGIVIGFYFGSSFSAKKLVDTANSQAQTIASHNQPPVGDKNVTLDAGQTATVSAKDSTT